MSVGDPTNLGLSMQGRTISGSFVDSSLLSLLKRGEPVTVFIDERTYIISPYKNLGSYYKPSSDPILRELVEETIAESHRLWRSIPETAVLVLKAIEDYGVGK